MDTDDSYKLEGQAAPAGFDEIDETKNECYQCYTGVC